MIKAQLEEYIKTAVSALGLSSEQVKVEHPEILAQGDYATNIALVLAKQTNSNPQELATRLVAELSKNKQEYIERVEVAGPGFINFHLTSKFFLNSIKEILDQQERFGQGNQGNEKKILVEYSSANIAKPFGIGHLRSTIIGDAIANILTASGYQVIRDNHLGDWGTQFGKLIVAIEKWGSLEEVKKTPEPIKYLVGLYVKFHQEAEQNKTLENEARAWFVKLEQGDAEARTIWQTCVDLSLKEFNRIYDRLGVKFDSAIGESFFEDKMATIVQELRDKHLLTKSEGAELVFFPEEILPPLMIIKSDGSTLYATRDLATDKYRQATYGSDITIINEVGSEQNLYFKQLFMLEHLLGWLNKEQRVHVAHGLVRGKNGKFSTRQGDSIWLEEVLDEGVKRAAAFNPDPILAEAVGIGAIKYNDLKRDSKADIIFDWDEILNLKGNSGPYLQYAYARIQSVLEKAPQLQLNAEPTSDEIGELERTLYRFPEVVERAANDYAPHHICTYLFEVASAFSAYYAGTKIIDDTPESSYKVALTQAVGIVLKNGLTLLGIAAPAKM